MILYHTSGGPVVKRDNHFFKCREPEWDGLFNSDGLTAKNAKLANQPISSPDDTAILPPIGSQEVWAAGVTYLRSRTARMEESEQGGASRFLRPCLSRGPA